LSSGSRVRVRARGARRIGLATEPPIKCHSIVIEWYSIVKRLG
jgi:hypothetical protein